MRLISVLIFLIGLGSALAAQDVHHERLFDHNGQPRSYFLHTPTHLKHAPHKVPLLVALHGMGGHAKNLRYGLGFNELADQLGFIVLYPQGLRLSTGATHWNAGIAGSDVDDTEFLSLLIQEVINQHHVDADQVHVLGISNGGFMAYHLACHSALSIAGIAVVIGSISGADWQDCHPTTETELLHIHGTEDALVRFDGSSRWNNGLGGAPEVPEVVRGWARRYFHRATQAPDLVFAGISQPDRIQIATYQSQASDARAALLAIKKFGHDWPFDTTSGLDAAQTISHFFFGAEELTPPTHRATQTQQPRVARLRSQRPAQFHAPE